MRVAGALGSRACQHGQADRAADLHGGVDQAGGQAGVLRRRAGHRERHQRGRREAGAEADQQRRGQDVDDEVAVDRRAGEQQQAGDRSPAGAGIEHRAAGRSA